MQTTRYNSNQWRHNATNSVPDSGRLFIQNADINKRAK